MSRAWRLAHPAEETTCRRAYRIRHSEAIRAYRLIHAEEIRAYSLVYSAQHRIELSAYARDYRKQHPDKVLDHNHRRRAAKRASLVEHVSRAEVFARDGGRCHVCHKSVDPKHWHLDHLIPLSLGGLHSYQNVAVAHPVCNMRRNSTGPAQLRLF
jgi:5-methylcytosine-specific restriction endonuclease McrA